MTMLFPVVRVDFKITPLNGGKTIQGRAAFNVFYRDRHLFTYASAGIVPLRHTGMLSVQQHAYAEAGRQFADRDVGKIVDGIVARDITGFDHQITGIQLETLGS